MWTPCYDVWHDLAADTDIIRQDAGHAWHPLSTSQRLHLEVENVHWLCATLPLCMALPVAAETFLWDLLQTQHLVSGGVKFGRAAGDEVLTLYGDLPLQPRAHLPQRWQALQQGVRQGLKMYERLAHGTPPRPPVLSLPSPLPHHRTEQLLSLLQDGGWHGVAQQGTVQVEHHLHGQDYRLTLGQHEAPGALQCRLACPLPEVLPVVCRQALNIFLLEGNSRVRLARFGYLSGASPSVVAEALLLADELEGVTLGQVLDATAVAAHVLWPVLSALMTEEVARLYLQTSHTAGVPGRQANLS